MKQCELPCETLFHAGEIRQNHTECQDSKIQALWKPQKSEFPQLNKKDMDYFNVPAVIFL